MLSADVVVATTISRYLWQGMAILRDGCVCLNFWIKVPAGAMVFCPIQLGLRISVQNEAILDIPVVKPARIQILGLGNHNFSSE